MESAPAMTGMQPLLFLSYSRADRLAVDRVRERLADASVSTFIDHRDLATGQPWPGALEDALLRASAVAVFIGPTGLGTWQKREMFFALDLQAQAEREGHSLPVVPVLLEGAGVAPGFLFLNTWVDLRDQPSDAAALVPLVAAVQGRSIKTAPVVDVNPFKGLRAFEEEDAGLFFGRESFVRQIRAKVDTQPWVTVVGPSGSGKSSVVKAGLAPALRRARPPSATWDVVVATPGGDPFATLASALIPLLDPELSEAERLKETNTLQEALEESPAALATTVRRVLEKSRGTDRLLIIVDQFEELFTQTPEPSRPAYLDSLLHAARAAPATVVLTLRADFYGRAIGAHREASDAIGACVVNLGPLTTDELRSAIEGPAQRVALGFEHGLVDAILRDVEGEPGALPLLEYTLSSLWDMKSGDRLTLADYEKLGGIEGAIASRADEVYQGFSPSEQETVQRLFVGLVRAARADEEGTDTRRRATKAEVGDEAWTIARRFASFPHRLLVMSRDEATGAESVEVAHEAIIRHWDQLGNWIDERRDFLLWLETIRPLVAVWEKSGRRDSGVLLGGNLLREARRWAARDRETLSDAEREFVKRSGRRSTRSTVLRRLAIGLVVLTTLLTGGGMLYSQTDHWQVHRILLASPSEVLQGGQGAAKRYLFSLGLLGRVADATHVLRTDEVPLDQTDRIGELALLATYRWSDDTPVGPDVEPLLLGLVAANRDGAVERILANMSDPWRICAEANLVGPYARGGRADRASLLADRARTAVETLSTNPVSQRTSWLCVIEAATHTDDHAIVSRGVEVLAALRGDPRSWVASFGSIALAIEGLSDHGWLAEAVEIVRLAGLPGTSLASVRALVPALVEAGQPGEAFRLLQSHTPPEPGSVAVWLVAGGRFDVALKWIETLPQGYEGQVAVKVLTQEAVRAGRVDVLSELASVPAEPESNVALAALQWLRDGDVQLPSAPIPYAYQDGLVETVLTLVSADQIDQGEQLLREVSPVLGFYAKAARAEIVRAWLSADQVDRARAAAQAAEEDWERHGLMALIAAYHLRRGDGRAAADLLEGDWNRLKDVLWSTTYRTDAPMKLGPILDELDRSELGYDAEQLIDDLAQDVAVRGGGEEGSAQATRLAIELARAGRLRHAREVSERATDPADLAFARAAILEQYALMHDTSLRDRLDAMSDVIRSATGSLNQ